jgi:hypothetical protein
MNVINKEATMNYPNFKTSFTGQTDVSLTFYLMAKTYRQKS